MGSTRKLTSELYPVVLDTLGLVPAVSWYSDLILKPKKIKVLSNIDDFVESFSSEYKLSLFRIIQESFHNIIKHASATEVEIELKKLDGSIRLTIKDNGVGFDFEQVKRKKDEGIGIMLMKERALSLAGQFEVKSGLNRGTKIMINIPL
jgi:signal transduction histidine kinase